VRELHDTAAAPAIRPQPAHRQLLGDFRSPGLLGRLPLIGLIMVLLGGILFCTLAIGVQTNSPLLQTDTQIVNSLHIIALNSSPFIVGVMIFGFYTGEQIVVGIGAVLVVYFLYKRFWSELIMVGVAWGGELVLRTVLSQYFNRTRPTFAVEVWHQMTAPSFPSGHSFGAVLCYGFLAYLLVPKIRSHFWKGVVIVGALLLILYVGFSRVFVGDHYPSDILAGYAIGIAWAGLVYTLVEWLALRKKQRDSRQQQGAIHYG